MHSGLKIITETKRSDSMVSYSNDGKREERERGEKDRGSNFNDVLQTRAELKKNRIECMMQRS